MASRLTIQDMRALAALHGGNCLSKEYWGKHTRLSWMCKRGHTWDAYPFMVQRGQWCVMCAGNDQKVFALELMHKWAEKRGGKCLSINYVNNYTPLKWKCGEGHRFSGSRDVIKNGKWCSECKKSAFRKRKLEEMQELAKSKGGKCLSAEYANLDTKLLMECKSGHQWKAKPLTLIYNNSWCPYCYGNIRHTIGYMHELAAKKQGKCLSLHYKNIVTPLRWQCFKGHKWSTDPMNIIAGNWCPACAEKKYTLSEVQTLAKTKGGKCISKKYINNKTKLKWECSEKHTWSAGFAQILSGSWCPACYRKRSALKRRGSTIEEMQKIAKAKGGKCLSEEYVNQRFHLTWQCSRGHVWKAVPQTVKEGSWCRACYFERNKLF